MSSNTPNGDAAAASSHEESKGEASEGQPQEEQFVNQGLRLWEQSRTQWLGHESRSTGSPNGSKISSDTDSTARPAAVPIEVDEIIEVVFAMPRQTATDEEPAQFPRTVPLPQMVDILVDLWEAEGLDI